MAQKTITELTLIDAVTDEVNFPGDDTIQTYRITAAQILAYILAAGNVVLSALSETIFHGLTAVTAAAADYLPIVDTSDSNKTKKVLVSDIAVPAGVYVPFGGTSAPTGWLLCDGTSYLKSAYPALYAAIGDAHGSADGTHFNVPDIRGRFVRGVDGGAARDPDAASRTAMATGGNTADNVGSVQGHAFQTHTHTGPVGQSVTTLPFTGVMNSSSGSSAVITNGTPSGSVSTETRPINVNANYIIKT